MKRKQKTLLEIDVKWKWEATDADGTVVLFARKPVIGYSSWRLPIDTSIEGYDYLVIYRPEAGARRPSNWRESLRRIEEYEEIA